MAFYTKLSFCNKAIAVLGSQSSIQDIDQPTTKEEKAFAEFYDDVKNYVIGYTSANIVHADNWLPDASAVNDNTYTMRWALPHDCKRLVSINDIIVSTTNQYKVEGRHIVLRNNDHSRLVNREEGNTITIIYEKDMDEAEFDADLGRLFYYELASDFGIAQKITSSPELRELARIEKERIKQAYMAKKANENKNIPVIRDYAGSRYENPRNKPMK